MTQTVSVAHAQAIIDSSDDAIISKDPEGFITSWNAGAERLYGYAASEVIGEHISLLIPPHRENEEQHILDTILRGERVDHYETERLCKDGTLVVISLTVSPMRDETGEIIGASVIARDITLTRLMQERATRLQRLTQALSREVSSARVAELLVEEAVPAVGADAAVVAFLDESGEELEVAASHGYTDRIAAWNTFPISAELPMAHVIRSGEADWSSDSQDARERFAALRDTEFAFEALATVPLVVDGATLGAVAFSFKRPREFAPDERAFMLATAQQAANALDRTRLHENERRARDQLAFIARSSEVLGASLDPGETLRTLAAIAVPQVADWCVVHLAEEDVTKPVALSHTDPEKVALARDLQERFPTDPDADRGVPQVMRMGQPELYSEIPDELLVETAQNEEHLQLLREIAFHSAMVVPLAIGDRVLGAITLVSSAESGRRYGDEDLGFAMELARHAALAIDNAQRYLREHQAAVTLQRALLPERLPKPEGIELAARYLPAGPGVEAGGDWYDAIDLGDGVVDISIGDVSGRGIPAASVMGRLRTAVHAYALDRLSPAATAERVDRLLSGLEGEEMATMLLLRFDPASNRAEYVRAGHPPALVRDPSGAVHELDSGGGSPPLGLMLQRVRPSASAEIAPGSLVLLYTDGLIERRGEVIDEGVDRLKRALETSADDLEPALDGIIEAVAEEAGEDDIAALLMRVG